LFFFSLSSIFLPQPTRSSWGQDPEAQPADGHGRLEAEDQDGMVEVMRRYANESALENLPGQSIVNPLNLEDGGGRQCDHATAFSLALRDTYAAKTGRD